MEAAAAQLVKALRIIVDAPWYVQNSHIRRTSK
jgi:hypothetical protein